MTKNSSVKVVLHYAWYCLLLVLIYYFLISMVVFFHFSLGHNFAVIDQWTQSYGWELIILTKMIAFLIMLLFINNYTPDKRPLIKYLKHWSFKLNRPTWVVITYLTCSLLLLGGPTHRPEVLRTLDVAPFLLAIIGPLIFFASDFFLLGLLEDIFAIPTGFASTKRLYSYIAFFVMFSIATYFLSPYRSGHSIFFLLHAAIGFLFLYANSRSQWDFLFYLLVVASPLNALWGPNYVSGELFIPFLLRHFSWVHAILLWPIAFIYLYLNLNEKHYNIFRRWVFKKLPPRVLERLKRWQIIGLE